MEVQYSLCYVLAGILFGNSLCCGWGEGTSGFEKKPNPLSSYDYFFATP
jgi:hypothetical protein